MKVYTEKPLPKLKKPQCFINCCDVFTGIVLDLDGKYNTEPNKFPVLLFESYEQAKDFAEKKVLEISYVECNIYNHDKEHIERIVSNNPERQPAPETQPPQNGENFGDIKL